MLRIHLHIRRHGRVVATRLLPFVFVLLMATFPVGLAAQENYEVTDVTFYGNHTFTEDVLLERMQMYAVGWFSRVILRKDRFLFSSEILESDVAELVRFYQSEGFLHVRIPPPKLIVDDKDREVAVAISIEEGSPILVGKAPALQFAGMPVDSAEIHAIAARDTAQLRLKRGMRFRDAALNADRGMLTESFNNNGFAYANTRFRLQVDTLDNLVAITWTLDPGPRCVFGDITVSGSKDVSPGLVTDNITFGKGEIFDPRLLEQSQRIVYSLGVFRVVTLQADMGGRDTVEIPVRIQTREAALFTSKFGIGAGTEGGFRAMTDMQFLNVFGGARKLNLTAKYSGLEPYNVATSLTQPNFPTRQSSVTIGPYIRRIKEPGFDVRRAGGNLSLLQQLGRHTNGFLAYSLERVDVYSMPAAGSLFFGTVNLEAYNKSSLSTGITYNSASPLFSPDRGFAASASYQLSGLGFGSPFRFMKTTLELKHYRQITGNLVFATRGRIGSTSTYSGVKYIPVEERFYSGGSTTVRGWGRQLLGPLDSLGQPLGGSSVVELNGEFRFPIAGLVSGAVFSDAGNVWSASNTFKLNELRVSFGVGLRVQSPIGPIRLDVARPFFDPEKRVQVHLDVGNAF